MQRLFGPVLQGTSAETTAAKGGDHMGDFEGVLADANDSQPDTDEFVTTLDVPVPTPETRPDLGPVIAGTVVFSPLLVADYAALAAPQTNTSLAPTATESGVTAETLLSDEMQPSATAVNPNLAIANPIVEAVPVNAGGWISKSDGAESFPLAVAINNGSNASDPPKGDIPLKAQETDSKAGGTILPTTTTVPAGSIGANVAIAPQVDPQDADMPVTLQGLAAIARATQVERAVDSGKEGQLGAATPDTTAVDQSRSTAASLAQQLKAAGADQRRRGMQDGISTDSVVQDSAGDRLEGNASVSIALRPASPVSAAAIAALQAFVQGQKPAVDGGDIPIGNAAEQLAEADFASLTQPRNLAAVYAPNAAATQKLQLSSVADAAAQGIVFTGDTGGLTALDGAFSSALSGDLRHSLSVSSSAGVPLGANPGVAGHFPSAAQLSAQILPMAQAAQSGPVELVLSPAELGHLRFEIHHRGEQVQIVLSAERPETLDLLRRNSDQLLSDFRNAGFTGASLSFGGWGAGQNDRAMPQNFGGDGQSGDGTATPLVASPAPSSSAAFMQPKSYLDPSRSLNLRL